MGDTLHTKGPLGYTLASGGIGTVVDNHGNRLEMSMLSQEMHCTGGHRYNVSEREKRHLLGEIVKAYAETGWFPREAPCENGSPLAQFCVAKKHSIKGR